jgi:hypothetical protein
MTVSDKSHWKAFDSLQKAAKNESAEAYALLGEYFHVGYNAAQVLCIFLKSTSS